MVLIISLFREISRWIYSFTLHNFSMWSLPHSDLGRTFVTKNKRQSFAIHWVRVSCWICNAYTTVWCRSGWGWTIKRNKTRLEKVAVFRCIPWRKRQWRKASRHILPFILLPFLWSVTRQQNWQFWGYLNRNKKIPPNAGLRFPSSSKMYLYTVKKPMNASLDWNGNSKSANHNL